DRRSSTAFPYTTLFRSERIPPGDRHRAGATATAKEREGEQRQVVVPRDRRAAAGTRRTGTPETPALGQAHDHDVKEAADGQAERSEEHTSELQSPDHLV